MRQPRQGRMTLTLILSGCVFLVILVTVLLIGIALVIADQTGLLGRWMEHASLLRFFLIIAAMSLVCGTLIALFLGSVPLRSMNKMTEGLHRLASGDYKAHIEPKGLLCMIAPVRDMVESFNATAAEMEGTEMLRSDFINNFSHEFKTPIVSIAGFAGLLKQGNLSREEQLEYLDIIESESRRLAQMATNVLNMTKVENQTILTDVTIFNLSEQLRTCVLLLERKWETKNLEMNLELEEHMISGNQELLKHVWVNLLDNAIKFSPKGQTVEISAAEEEGRIAVSICNTGSFIPKEQQEAIFRKFYQADRSHNTEGNGIGLAVVKRVVELHGGTVAVESNPSFTKFTVTLPKKQQM
ncbi:MAG: HAMP domain-containing sensor histidine kinase [Candidatus Faecousia sp.]|nr:HAMP domain-containing sensor histidine kinase [Candidatus Faecousia sp.]